MSESNTLNSPRISPPSTAQKMGEVEETLADHISLCRARHAVINAKLDGLSRGVDDIRHLILAQARQDGRQDAEIAGLKAAKVAGKGAGSKAGAVVGGGLAALFSVLSALGEALGWW